MKSKSSLRTFRTKAGLTQAELADRAGISKRTLQEYEQGRKNVNGMALETAVKLADALGCNAKDLLDERRKKMTKKDYDNLRWLNEPGEVPEAVYAVNMYERHGRDDFFYYILLDKDLNEIEAVRFNYSITGKIQVAALKEDANTPAFAAYQKEPLGDKYVKLIRTEDTEALMKAATKAFV